jgi:hypothetical protein
LILSLKYSPSTTLTASGIDSSFRAFLWDSSAFTMSSDMATTILFIAKLDTPRTVTLRDTAMIRISQRSKAVSASEEQKWLRSRGE